MHFINKHLLNIVFFFPKHLLFQCVDSMILKTFYLSLLASRGLAPNVNSHGIIDNTTNAMLDYA